MKIGTSLQTIAGKNYITKWAVFPEGFVNDEAVAGVSVDSAYKPATPSENVITTDHPASFAPEGVKQWIENFHRFYLNSGTPVLGTGELNSRVIDPATVDTSVPPLTHQ